VLVRGAGTRCCAGAGMLTFLHVLAWLSVRCSVRSPALLGANKESLSPARAAQTHYCLVSTQPERHHTSSQAISQRASRSSLRWPWGSPGPLARTKKDQGPDHPGLLDVILSSPCVSVPARCRGLALESGMRVPPSSWSVLGCGAGLKLHVFIFEDPHSTGQPPAAICGTMYFAAPS